VNCHLSFADLHRLARGGDWTAAQAAAFAALSQPEKNALVRQLADEAGGIETEDQTGDDGVVYTAFWRTGDDAPAAST
jgi:hypothetical protein